MDSKTRRRIGFEVSPRRAALAAIAALACGGRTDIDGLSSSAGSGFSAPGGAPSSAGGAIGGLAGRPADESAGRGSAEAGETATAGAGGNDTRPEPLWRESYEPFCSGRRESHALDIWSDQRGVYVFVGGEVSFNSGSGWVPSYVATRDIGSHLRGFPGGTLIEYGPIEACSVHFVTTGMRRCSAAIAGTLDLFVVHDELAYAIKSDRVFVYDGRFWTQLGEPIAAADTYARAVWSSGAELFVATSSGVLAMSSATGRFTDLDAPEGDYLVVWGFASNDVWFGTRAGDLVHYDGRRWRTVWTSECGEIRGLWGVSGELFLHTASAAYAWSAGQARSIISLDCDGRAAIRGLWGNSPSEVFLAVDDPSASGSPCGFVQLFWFDGQRLSRL